MRDARATCCPVEKNNTNQIVALDSDAGGYAWALGSIRIVCFLNVHLCVFKLINFLRKPHFDLDEGQIFRSNRVFSFSYEIFSLWLRAVGRHGCMFNRGGGAHCSEIPNLATLYICKFYPLHFFEYKHAPLPLSGLV